MSIQTSSENGNTSATSAAVLADPMTVFLDAHYRSLPPSRGTKRFNAGEHAWLASRGADLACANLKKSASGIQVDARIFSSIARRDKQQQLQYGELVALSGDFYESPDALFDEKPSPLPWLWEANDLSDLRAIFAKELKWIEDRLQQQGGKAPYPDDNIRMAWNAKSYVELALRNVDHFGWHNIVAYCRYHTEAMALAASADGRENENFRRALYTNAFADHFLTDGFAAGHVRVPRAEICDWAASQGLNDKIAGALSKLLHDQDGHVDVHSLHGEHEEGARDSSDGLQVMNSEGDAWHTYCDGQLFLDGSEKSPAVDRAVKAVADSVTELLFAWKRRQFPKNVYAATTRVPFPHPRAPTLTQKFAADMPDSDFEALWKSVQWYAKVPWISGLQPKHLRSLFSALPAIMKRFRENVAAEAAQLDIGRRIAPAYIDAYKRIA